MHKGVTKPHTFSWLIWSLVTAIGYLGQVSDGGGAGTWSTLIGAIFSFTVFIGSLKVGEKSILQIDWICLTLCLIGIALWQITSTPLWTIILISLVDTIAFIPTFNKTFKKPRSETLSVYYLSILKFALGLVSLENFSFITALFPATIMSTNFFFVLMTLYRRKQI